MFAIFGPAFVSPSISTVSAIIQCLPQSLADFFSLQTMAQMLKCTLFLTFFEFDKRSQKIMMMALMPGC